MFVEPRGSRRVLPGSGQLSGPGVDVSGSERRHDESGGVSESLSEKGVGVILLQTWLMSSHCHTHEVNIPSIRTQQIFEWVLCRGE